MTSCHGPSGKGPTPFTSTLCILTAHEHLDNTPTTCHRQSHFNSWRILNDILPPNESLFHVDQDAQSVSIGSS